MFHLRTSSTLAALARQRDRVAAKSEQWWSVADLARMLNVSEPTVRRRARSGRWPHQKIGRLYRFTNDDIQEIKQSLTVDTDYFYDRDRIARMLENAA